MSFFQLKCRRKFFSNKFLFEKLFGQNSFGTKNRVTLFHVEPQARTDIPLGHPLLYINALESFQEVFQ